MSHRIGIVQKTDANRGDFERLKRICENNGLEVTFFSKDTFLSSIIKTNNDKLKKYILFLIDSDLPKNILENLLKARESLGYDKSANSPMIEFVCAPGQEEKSKAKWRETTDSESDDFHHFSTTYLSEPVQVNQLLTRAKARWKNAVVGTFLYESENMEELATKIQSLANNRATVLVYGETGTGKELVARSLHYNGKFFDKPFIVKDCAAISETLRESELFGHVKGAFTDAREDKKSPFELAHGGAVFLDEVGELTVSMQKGLLRLLQEKKIQRLGGNKYIPVDVRIIAATNKDLKEEVKNGRFREDLYYRLKVVPLKIPPLRQRPDCIYPLIKYFIKKFAKKHQKKIKKPTPEFLEFMKTYPWPGNVRELENTIECIYSSPENEKNGDTIDVNDLQDEIRLYAPSIQDFDTDDSGPLTTGATNPFSVSGVMKNNPGNHNRHPLNPKEKTILNPIDDVQDREIIKTALTESGGKLASTATLLTKAGYSKNCSRGFLKNLLGITKTQNAKCEELAAWYRDAFGKNR